MKTTLQKHQIMESLNDLDQTQTEDVLRYIQRLVSSQRKVHHHQSMTKREALLQIRQALSGQKGAQASL